MPRVGCLTTILSLRASTNDTERFFYDVRDIAAIEKAVALIVLDCPDLVISWILGIDQKTAQFWRDRCLDAASEWSAESKLTHDAAPQQGHG